MPLDRERRKNGQLFLYDGQHKNGVLLLLHRRLCNSMAAGIFVPFFVTPTPTPFRRFLEVLLEKKCRLILFFFRIITSTDCTLG